MQDLGLITAYAYAKSTGEIPADMTPEQFAHLLASYTTVAQAAAASAEAAAGSAEAAGRSASAASESETNAGRSASDAEAAKVNAVNAANTATEAKNTAVQRASNAADSATAASESEGLATQAKVDAVAAKDVAVAAQGAAETAQGKAEDAQGAAEDAQSAAEAAAQGVQSSLDQISQNASDISDLQTAMETKAEIDGYYEEMTVGDAEQLVATQYVEDSVPYLYRTTGGTADVGNREYVDKIVGGTVAWNQLVQNGNFADAIGWNGTNISIANNTAIVSQDNATGYVNLRLAQTSRFTFFANHKYLLYVDVSSLNGRVGLVPTSASGDLQKTFTNIFSLTRIGIIFGFDSDKEATLDIRFALTTAGVAENLSGTIKNYNCIDLTQAFGTTIADYIYQLEQTTAGAGVTFFRKLFPNMDAEYSYLEDPSDETSIVTKKLRDYEAGILLSVEGLSAHETVGFNAYDHATGTAKVVGGMQYQITGAYTAVTDEDGNSVTITGGLFTPNKSQTLTVTGGNATDTCIHLVWSGTRNGEYMPYQKHSYPLDSSLVLRGIPKLDAANNLYYDGDEYLPDGTVNRRYGIVDLGTLTWAYVSSTNWKCFNTNSLISLKAKGGLNIVCSRYKTSIVYGTQDNKIISGNVNNGAIYIRDTDYTDASAFKAAMSGVYLVYELATPTTESAEPYQEIQICDDWGTEKYVSTGMVPIGHETRYPANLRDKLQHLPNLADSDGYYMINQSGSQMTLERFRIPKAPSSPDGTYVLKATVSSGTPTYVWEAVTE